MSNDPSMKVIVTGASRGLGLATAEIFATHGYDLLLNSRREKNLMDTKQSLQKKFPNISIEAMAADLSTKKAAQDFGRWCLSQGNVSVLVNNAGSFAGGNVHDEEEGALEEMINTNLYSAYHLTRVIVPAMMRRKEGHIFNMSSIAGMKAYPGGGAYSISKFALHGFSANLRHEMMGYNIKVTTVFPGAAYTDSWAATGLERKRFMEASDIAKMIFASSQLSATACVEDIILRPQTGDI
jgi:short-subunit dehydrogenase